jgi:hypothetical protein
MILDTQYDFVYTSQYALCLDDANLDAEYALWFHTLGRG